MIKVVIYSIRKWTGKYFYKLFFLSRKTRKKVCLRRDFWQELEVIDINVVFDIIIRHMGARKCLKIYSSTMFLTNDLFCVHSSVRNKFWNSSTMSWRWSRLNGNGEETRDICRQSLSRQMSDNTIVWWVWMTGSFVSSFSHRRLFSVFFLCFLLFSRDLSEKRQL